MMAGGPAPIPAPSEAKSALRATARARRAAAHAESAASAGAAVRDNFLAAIEVAADAVLGGYWPFRDEIDARPLFHHFHARGHPCGLPVIVGAGSGARVRPLIFRPWRPEMKLAKGRLGEPVPPPDADYGTGELSPDILLVPLLAFDRRGYRVGYGGGHFDATIAGLRAAKPILAVGLGYSVQEVDCVPFEPHDQRLDWIVTERAAQPSQKDV
ncbi:MAG: 5-formyltetrahydrofolate cyclo-ligase [Alphaproteobacteria bacterium]